MHTMDVTITSCNDGSYCCGNGTIAKQCCNQKKGVFMLNGDAIPYPQFRSAFSASTGADVQSSTSLSNTSPSSITPSTFSTYRPDISSLPGSSVKSASSAPSPSSNSRVVTVSIFGVCAVLLLIGALAFILRRLRPKKAQNPAQPASGLEFTARNAQNGGTNELDGYQEFELDRPGNYPEMPTSTNGFSWWKCRRGYLGRFPST